MLLLSERAAGILALNAGSISSHHTGNVLQMTGTKTNWLVQTPSTTGHKSEMSAVRASPFCLHQEHGGVGSVLSFGPGADEGA